MSLQDVVSGSGFVAFSAKAGGNARVKGWEMWISQYSEGHGAEAVNNRDGGGRVRVVDKVVSIERGELGEHFQFLSRVAKSIVGQGSRGV